MIILTVVTLFFALQGSCADKPCQARQIYNQSVVCVCNEQYCDTVTRKAPENGGYVAYTSNKAGLRFQKQFGWLQDCGETPHSATVLKLNPKKVHQTMKGIGGAVTDSATMNWKRLIPSLQRDLVESYFSDKGIEYSMVRVPIGGCDFSTHGYAYNELPENDTQLSNFSLSIEDIYFKIPMIKAAMEMSSTPLLVLGSTWSPPAWMKTNDMIYGRSCLKEEYFQTYADYHLKFIEEYAKRGVKVWAVTNGNEPFDGSVYIGFKLNSLGWTPESLGKWLTQYLGPTLKNSKYNDTLILSVDDQRFLVPIWFNLVVYMYPEVLKYIDGIAVHWYGDAIIPASFLSFIAESYPEKFLIGTEACNGFWPKDEKVVLGSWERAEYYVKDIIEDISVGFVGWMDWNLCLDSEGGPNYISNFVDSPVIVTSATEFLKQPMFYGLGHFSKFVPRGSKRIELAKIGKSIDAVAFVTPQDTVVVVIYNGKEEFENVTLQLGRKQIDLFVDPRSFTTVEISREESNETIY